MIKSIYEEALEIIDKNTFELGKGLDVLKPTYRETVVKALEKAQKQEKLLKLYQRLHNNVMTILEFQDIVKQIKELENE